MNIFMILFLLIFNILFVKSFIQKRVTYKINKLAYKNNKIILYKNHFKLYKLKCKNKFSLYSKKGIFSNLIKIKECNIKNMIEYVKLNKENIILKNNFIYLNNLFNKCRLDRILVTLSTVLYFILQRVEKRKEKKVKFMQGKIVAIEDRICEKYKCNYMDIYKNKNYKTFLTSIFVHKNLFHLYFNMRSLISIYKLISLIYSNTQILTVFILSGFFANIFSYLYDMKQKKKIIFDEFLNTNKLNQNNRNKIICGSSSAIYSLYALYLSYIISFYFKHHYIVNTNFLYNFIYSFLTSLFLENVSHLNHMIGFLIGTLFSFLIILYDKN